MTPAHIRIARSLLSGGRRFAVPVRRTTHTAGLSPARRIKRTIAPIAMGVTLTLGITACPAMASSPLVFGAVGDVAGLSRASGVPLAENRYARLDANVPSTRMINLMPNSNWATIAAAGPGSATYTALVRWGNTLKSRGPVWLAFSHEPEAKGSSGLGNASQFIAAFRKVVTVIRGTGARNVSFTWQMTAWAFQTNPSDPRYAAKWYPGDAYVDTVSADAYNWYNCGSGRAQWLDLSQISTPALQFASAHHKQLVLGEYGSQANARRAQWLRNASGWAKANSGVIRGMFYFQHADAGHSRGCNWILSSGSDYSAFGQTAR